MVSAGFPMCRLPICNNEGGAVQWLQRSLQCLLSPIQVRIQKLQYVWWGQVRRGAGLLRSQPSARRLGRGGF